MRGHGLRVQMLLASLSLVGILLLALVVLLAQDRRNRRDVLEISRESQARLVGEVARSHATAITTQLSESLVNDLYYFDLASIGTQLEFVRQLPLAVDAVVFNADGEILHDGSREISGYGSALHQPLIVSALADDETHVVVFDHMVEAARQIRIGDEVLGGVRIRFDLDGLAPALEEGERHLDQRFDDAARSRIMSLAVLIALVAVLGVTVSWLFQRRIVWPVLRLAGAVRRMEAGEYDGIRLDRGRADELGELERAFERMSERVAETYRVTERDANVDKLTGLPNRRAFDGRIAAGTSPGAETSPFALMFIDADNLKQINDRHGHEAGDAALAGFAQRARDVLTTAADHEAWLARIGGDEFAVIFKSQPLPDAALRLADAIIAAANRLETSDLLPALTVSVGIALFPDHAITASDLLRCADQAMYTAKRAGKGAVRLYQPDPVPVR